MNYLAHAFLSHSCPEAILGALLGDFVKGPIDDCPYPAAVRDAILLHRAIDRYTDAHPVVLSSHRLVSDTRRRFAPIMVDIFYDHFLARHWDEYCEIPLHDFTRQVYRTVLEHENTLPERLRAVAPRMATDDWLSAYASIAGMEAAINGVARRLRRFARAAALHGGAEELVQQYALFAQDFRRFFPELRDYAADCRRLSRAA